MRCNLKRIAKKEEFMEGQKLKSNLSKAMSSKITEITTDELYYISEKTYD